MCLIVALSCPFPFRFDREPRPCSPAHSGRRRARQAEKTAFQRKPSAFLLDGFAIATAEAAREVVPNGRDGRGRTNYRKEHPMTDAQAINHKPTHIAYHVRDRNGNKAIWTRIGVAWEHKDRLGFNIEVIAAPLNGRISLRIATEKKD